MVFWRLLCRRHRARRDSAGILAFLEAELEGQEGNEGHEGLRGRELFVVREVPRCRGLENSVKRAVKRNVKRAVKKTVGNRETAQR